MSGEIVSLAKSENGRAMPDDGARLRWRATHHSPYTHAMVEERLYIVTYDIADDKRWRRVFKLMHGYGRWLQLSVFQCRLTARRRAELARRLEEAIHGRDDHVLILDLGPADKVDPRVESLGKSFTPVTRAAVVI